MPTYNAKTWDVEFPDYGDIMPFDKTKHNMIDSSWHNDGCPSFSWFYPDGGAAVTVFADYEDTTKREFPQTDRYSLQIYMEDGDIVCELICTDSLDQLYIILDALQIVKGLNVIEQV